DSGFHFVDILATRTTTSEERPIHIGRVYFYFYTVVDQRIHINASKGSVPSGVAVERGDPYQPVHTALGFEETVSKRTFELQGNTFHSCTFTFLIVEFRYSPALLVTIHPVHPHQHFGPVLAFCATSA